MRSIALKLLAPALATAASLAGAGSLLAQTAIPTTAFPVHGVLRMARLDHPTVEWTPAPTQLTLPVGAHVGFEYTLERPHLAAWDGAMVTELGNFSSQAEFVAREEGFELVKLIAFDPGGPVLERIYENVQVLAPSDFAALVARGEITEAGVLIERGDVDGGDDGSIGLTSPWGPLSPWLSPWIGSGPPGGVPGHGMVPGPGPGPAPNPGPVLWCSDSCAIDVYDVSYLGNYEWQVLFTITNYAKCDASFRISGSTGKSGEITWAAPSLAIQTGKIPKLGGSKSYAITVTYTDDNWSSVPVGHQFFKLYAIGSHTPIPTTGGGPYFNCSKNAVDLCFSGCNNP